jgi:hypothetical protein
MKRAWCTDGKPASVTIDDRGCGDYTRFAVERKNKRGMGAGRRERPNLRAAAILSSSMPCNFRLEIVDKQFKQEE